jgi:TonB family protein
VRKIVLALAGLCCVPVAVAQSAGDPVTKERMERAKRDASNPLRIIIEASQARRTKAADAAPTVAAPAAEARLPDTAKAVAQRKPPRGAEPAPVPAPAAATVAAEPAASPLATQRTLAPGSEAAPTNLAPEASAAAAGAVPVAAVPLAAVPAAASLAAPAAAASGLPNHAQSAAEVPAPLKLVRYIEPEIPARIRTRLRPSSEVTVSFKVKPDGSVSDVGIRATTARALDPIVLDAVRQWRYDPVPEQREHVVQLVFNLTE